MRTGGEGQEPDGHEERRANPDAWRRADAAPQQFARVRRGLPRQQADRLDPPEDQDRHQHGQRRRGEHGDVRFGNRQQQPVEAGEHRVAGRQPAGNRVKACGHLVVPPVRGAAPTVTVCGSLDAVASGTYIAAICAGIALNTPGVVTLSR